MKRYVDPQETAESKRPRGEDGESLPDGLCLGRVIWYNGRRQIGKVLGDDGRQLFVPVGGALNGNIVPLTPAGLMHGTRVSFIPVALSTNGNSDACKSVQPYNADAQMGLQCGVESRIGGREENQDRLAASDLFDIGFLAGVFDGHAGTACVDYVKDALPQWLHQIYSSEVQKLEGGIRALAPKKEADFIATVLKKAFEATDQEFCRSARQLNLVDGCTAVVALLAHGFEVPKETQGITSTVSGIEGGVAKLFTAWCGDSRAVLIRGKRALRLSSDHKPGNADEKRRIEDAGGIVTPDALGLQRVGTRVGSPGPWLSTSRAFGDLSLKEPAPLVVADPEISVRTLTREDWAVVLVCDGITDVLTNQEIADECWEIMVRRGQGPVEAAQAVVDRAQERGSTDNSTVFVMRLGWAMPAAEAAI